MSFIFSSVQNMLLAYVDLLILPCMILNGMEKLWSQRFNERERERVCGPVYNSNIQIGGFKYLK